MKNKRILIIVIFFFCTLSVFAGGQKDLTKKPQGYGVLVIGNDGKLTAVDGIKWTYEIVYLNSTDGKEYSIEIPELKNKIAFYYFPAGKYKALRSIPHHFSGSEYINDDGYDITEDDEIKYNFEIKENEITLFNYFLYKFNNKKKPGQDVMTDVEDYILPKDFINKFGSASTLYRWDYNPVTIQYTWFLSITRDIEKTILNNLIQIEGASQWLYRPKYSENIALWPNIPKDEKVVEKKKVEKIPWTIPDLKPRGILRVFSAGIDNYNNKTLNLTHSVSDADKMIKMVKDRESSSYESVQDVLPLDGATDISSFLSALDSLLSKTTSHDSTVVYISSQGISDLKGRPYIMFSGSEINNIAATCLPVATVYDHLKKGNGLILCILDVGRKGPWMDENKALFSYNPQKLMFDNTGDGKSIGLYSVSNGEFTRLDNQTIGSLLFNNGSYFSNELWKQLSKSKGGFWYSSPGYAELAKKRTSAAEGRKTLLEKLKNLMDSGKKAEALSLIDSEDFSELFSDTSLSKLKENVSSFINVDKAVKKESYNKPIDSSKLETNGLIRNSDGLQNNKDAPLNAVGKFLALNGIDEFVNIPFDKKLAIKDKLTIEALVKINKFSNRPCGFMDGSMNPIINQSDVSWAGNYTLGLSQYGAFFMFESREKERDLHYVVNYYFAEGRWYHLAVTHTFGEGSKTAFYVNGKLLKGDWVSDFRRLIDGDGLPIPQTRRSYWIGAIERSDPLYLNGEIDELRIWNKILSQEDIKKNMQKSLTGKEPGLVGNFTFDD